MSPTRQQFSSTAQYQKQHNMAQYQELHQLQHLQFCQHLNLLFYMKPRSERQRDPVGWAQRHPVEAARLAEAEERRKGKGGSKGSSGQKGCGQQSSNIRS